MAEVVDKALGAQVQSFADMKVKFDDIKDMIGQLFIAYKYQDDEEKKSKLSDFGKSYLNANQYLHLYSETSVFKGMFARDNRQRLFGKGIDKDYLYEYDVSKYYGAINDYMKEMKQKIHEDQAITNFVRLFALVCKQSSEITVSEETIRSYIKNYLLASCIEVDDNVMSFDFSVSLAKDTRNHYKQLCFDMSDGKKSHLVGLDCIYVPQNWMMSSSELDQALVPTQSTDTTKELDILYNSILNAMGQRLVNVLGLYRMQVKKRNDLQITRVLMGSGKNRTHRRTHSADIRSIKSLTIEKPYKNIMKRFSEFDMKQFELYYRTILICKYYQNFFITQGARSVMLVFKPENDTPEGELLRFFFDRHGKNNKVLDVQYTPSLIE